MTKLLNKTVLFTGRPNTINQCLMILGAKKDDVYLNWKSAIHPSKYFWSIYNRYTMDDLYYMVEKLYKESIKKYHVDLHSNSGNRTFYEEKTKRINEAHQRALKILKNRGR